MINYLKYFKKYLIHTKFFIILFLFWVSLNTGSKYFDIEFLKSNFSENKLNFIRSLLPYLILIYFTVNLIVLKKKISLNFDNVFKLFLAYGLFQILGLAYYNQNLYEHYWVICLISLIFYYHFILQENNKELIQSIFLFNIFLTFVVFTIFIFVTFKENIFTSNLLYHSDAFVMLFQNEALPRSSGLSRMGLIIFLVLNALYLSKSYSSKLNLLFITLNIFIISIILLLQSRGAILGFILIFVLINILYKFESFKFRLKYFILFIFIPCLIFIIYPNSKVFLMSKFGNDEKVKLSPKKEIKIKNLEIGLREDLISDLETDNNLKSKIYAYSNNRVNAWEYLLQMFFKNQINESMKMKLKSSNYDHTNFLKKHSKNLLTGHGPQSDRHFLHNKISNVSETVRGPFGAHASNGYIYSLICSGILGFISFSMINIIILYKIYTIYYNRKIIIFNKDPFLSSSILITIFLLLRTLIENSYSVFGVDLLILISAYIIINRKYGEISI